ncbi:LacI family transcriptional regulator [Pseudonocardia sp. HH130630-07]|nr:LacI family transcriptional regulator [Pseudonocardia sp. HH130630-07]
MRGPSMVDVARLAGVSHQTVSRVLNDHPNVRAGTRTRVRSAIAELGYRPNRAARTLVTGRDRTIGVVAPRSTEFGPVSLLAAFEDHLAEAGFDVTVVRAHERDDASVGAGIGRLLDSQVAGILVIAPLVSTAVPADEVTADVPLVVVGGDPARPQLRSSVDQFEGGRLATAHLLGLGHRTVWHVGGPAEYHDAAQRAEGWRAALHAAGSEIPPVVPGDWSAGAGHVAGHLLARMPEVTAVFAANDALATGLLHAFHELGRAVPGEVSVVGFDDAPSSAHLIPPLTTVRPDFGAVAGEVLDLLLSDLHQRGRGTTEDRRVAPVLVPRSTTAPPQR